MSRTFRRICLALALLLCAAGAWAETTLSLSPVFTWSYADLREYVYLYPSYKKLSQLDWDAHNVIQYGARTDVMHNRFLVSAEVAVVQKGESGLMQDYDWMFAKMTNPPYPESEMTEFSEHPVTILEKNMIDVRAAWKIFVKPKFSLAAGGGFQYLKTYLHGHDGYLQHSNYLAYPTVDDYSPYDPDRPKWYVSGNVISYQQEIESLWLDVRADFKFTPSFTLTVDAGISPWQLIDCDDYHFTSNNSYVWYYDNPQSSVMFRASLSAGFAFTRRSSLVLSAGFQSLPYADGNSYVHSSNTELNLYTGQLGGTGYQSWDVSLSYRIRIF